MSGILSIIASTRIISISSQGVHREVCIDKLEFNADGTIKRVVPTHGGIQ